MDCSPPGSFIHGILQARILEWGAISSSMGSSWPRDQTHISCIAGSFLPIEPPGEPLLIQAHLKFSEKRGLRKRTYKGTRIISHQGQPGGWLPQPVLLLLYPSHTPLIYLSHIIINIHYFISSFIQQPTFQDVDLKVSQNNTYEYFSFSKPLPQDI